MSIIQSFWSFALQNYLITLAVIICGSIYAVLKLKPQKGRNPFLTDTRKPLKPLEIDQMKRDAILRQGFLAKRVPENLDVIVIGSGIGGLTAANILARVGMSG